MKILFCGGGALGSHAWFLARDLEQHVWPLGRLIAISENYPDLKSNQNFLSLQSQLEGTENRISVARRDYIQAVQAYNTETRTFPGRLWAIVYNAKPMATFATAEENQRPPTVKF